MGLSNYIPSSRLSQAGVCTSTTRPASPYEGQMIYETDTNRVLVYDASAWVMIADTDTPPGLELVKTKTIGSAVTSETVSDCFSSTYDSYRVVISNVTMSSTASGTTVWLKMHDGTNPASTNYNYAYARIDIAATTVAGVTASLGTNGVLIGRGTGDKYGSSLDIVNPNIATHTLFPSVSAQNVSTGYMYMGTAMHQSSTAYTGFQVIVDTGTMTGGTIRVYGYRN